MRRAERVARVQGGVEQTDDGAADYVARLDALCAAVGRLLTERYAPDDPS